MTWREAIGWEGTRDSVVDTNRIIGKPEIAGGRVIIRVVGVVG